MVLAGAGCVFMGFILCISGVQGRANGICALKGSSVDLPCSAKHPTSNVKWYTAYKDRDEYTFDWKELSADGNRITYNMSEESNSTLTIKDLRESDAKFYCCRENTDEPIRCWIYQIQLHVADLQVKVIPTTEGQTVTLMCSTCCRLTEEPAAYIWYKNREFLYEDWSPWYQQLVSSEEAVTYSCAIKGYEDLRAPEVSVDSVTSTCFNVTYAKGRMCSYKQKSVDKPCSITYPREVHVGKNITCDTSCPLIDSKTKYRWYEGGLKKDLKSQQVHHFFNKGLSCAVKDHKDLLSAEVCIKDKNCWRVNYVNRRICALEGSSVNISSEYLHPDYQQPRYKFWCKIKRSSEELVEKVVEAAGRVEYHDNMMNLHILRIQNLRKNDSAEYAFKQQLYDGVWGTSDVLGVIVIVTGLKVMFTPSAVVTEGQRVTLTCSTSCPLPDDTNYIWYLNSRPLTLPENQTKHLVLDTVSSQHAGSYSCAVSTHNNISSHEKTLTVHSKMGMWTSAEAAGGCAVLLVLIPLAALWWIRKKRSSSQSTRTETSGNVEQVNSVPMYENISAQSTEQNDYHYGTPHFSKNHTDVLYANIQPVPSINAVIFQGIPPLPQ